MFNDQRVAAFSSVIGWMRVELESAFDSLAAVERFYAIQFWQPFSLRRMTDAAIVSLGRKASAIDRKRSPEIEQIAREIEQSARLREMVQAECLIIKFDN